MSEQEARESDVPPELVAAIEDNPEAVAAFVERLDAVNGLLDVLALGEEALDDEMAVTLAGTGATLAESADELATEETVALAGSVGDNGGDLAEALETLAALQRTGTLDDLVELADVVSLASNAVDDEMAVSLARTGASVGELADTAAEDDTRQGLQTLLKAVGDAERDDVEPVGLVGTVRAARDPEVKAGLGYLLSLARALGGRHTDEGIE
jgi:uncharacterized protein YjgD (DUF1641 family)